MKSSRSERRNCSQTDCFLASCGFEKIRLSPAEVKPLPFFAPHMEVLIPLVMPRDGYMQRGEHRITDPL